MQQIKLRNKLKKKSLTIESIRVELFEKNPNSLSRKLATISTAEQDRIFTPSKRHLTPVFPLNELYEKTPQSNSLQKIDNSKMGRWIIREREQLRNIKRYFSMNKQFNKLSQNLSHSIDLCKQQIKKIQEWGQAEEQKNVTMNKSISLKIQKIRREKKGTIEKFFNHKYPRQYLHKRESLLLPLQTSIDHQNQTNISTKNPRILKMMEVSLLEKSNRSKCLPKINKNKRETHISPWRVEKLKETHAQFPY